MNLEEIKLKFHYDLFQKRKIFLDENIDNAMANRVGSMITWLNSQDDKKEIVIYINSSGGGVLAGFDIYDIIRHSQAPVRGVVYRQAGSMAIVVLQACDKRESLKHSEFYFHNLRLNIDKEWDEIEEKIKERFEGIKKDQEEYNMILAKRTGIEPEKIKELCKEKKILSAQEAKEMGLIDEII